MHTKTMTYPGHVKAVTVLGLPLIGGHLAQMAIGVTDTVMLGWYSVDALAAGVLGSTFFFTLFLFGAGFAWAVMPMVASQEAEGDEVALRRTTRMGLWLSVAYSLLVLPLMFWSRPVLDLLGQDPGVAEDAARYLRIAGFGIVPALLVMTIKSYLAALERTNVVLVITIASAFANAIVNWALIFGNWGAPEMGVVGAAVASVVTQIVALIGIIIYAVWVFPHHQMFVRLWRADWDMLGRVFKLGLPIGLTSLSETGLFAGSTLMMGWLGTVPLAAHGIAMQLVALTFMMHLGLSNVATIRASNAFGRRDWKHMARGGHVVTVMSLVFALLTIAVFVGMPMPFINAFMQENEPARAEIMAIGVGLLAMAALFQMMDGIQVIALGLLRGIQDTAVPMVIAAFSYWAVGIPCSYLLGFVFGYEGVGVWSGLVVGLAVAALLLMLRFWAVSYRRLKSTPPKRMP